MAAPVKTDKWAGNLDCTGECRRKRLMAEEFSKSALERYYRRKNNESGTLCCKRCVEKAEQAEREAAAARKTSEMKPSDESRVCVTCNVCLNQSEFNKNQWNKGEGVSRCRVCVEKAVANEGKAAESTKAAKLLEMAKKSGNSTEVLKAESVVAALEAQKVTGLKPIRMNRGSGRGGRGSGSTSRRGGR